MVKNPLPIRDIALGKQSSDQPPAASVPAPTESLWPSPEELGLELEEPAEPFFDDLSQQRYRIPIDFDHAVRVLESIGEGVMIINPSGICLYANPAAGHVIGVTRDELLRCDIHKAVHPEGFCPENCWFFTPFEDALEHLDKPDRWVTRHGTDVPIELSVAPLVTDGQVTSVVLMFHDASEKVARERERLRLRKAQERAIAELRTLNEQKTDFVYTVSHELRTPLTSILGYLELLLESESLSNDDREWAEVAMRNASRLLSQVEALLTVSRIESGRAATRMADTPVSQMVLAITEVVGPQAEAKEVTLHLTADDTLRVWADGSQVERALINVAGNAVKFTPQGGDIWIDIERKGDFAQFRVEDTGVGIPAADQQHLFEKFFRASNAQKQAIQGTGLGLAIVKAIVEDHGGAIALNSEENKGTVVAFTIPLTRDSYSPSEPTVGS